MKKFFLMSALLTMSAMAFADNSIDINTTSLEKTSPFETPTPKAFAENAGQYRETQLGAPAIIPHDIANYPITPSQNMCMMCHGNAANMKAPKVKGQPAAMPESHWVTVDGKPVMQPSRHQCTLCHAPQADVKPLVETLQ